MFNMSRSFVRRSAILGSALALTLSTQAFAAAPQAQASAAPATGLGQSWPNASDVSASPNWHVYVFQRDGIRYIQINDLNGTVHAAVATANGTFLVLPLGSDAQSVSTPDNPVAGTRAGEVVYKDSAVQISLTPQSDGTATWSSALVLKALGSCTNPRECSSTAQ